MLMTAYLRTIKKRKRKKEKEKILFSNINIINEYNQAQLQHLAKERRPEKRAVDFHSKGSFKRSCLLMAYF